MSICLEYVLLSRLHSTYCALWTLKRPQHRSQAADLHWSWALRQCLCAYRNERVTIHSQFRLSRVYRPARIHMQHYRDGSSIGIHYTQQSRQVFSYFTFSFSLSSSFWWFGNNALERSDALHTALSTNTHIHFRTPANGLDKLYATQQMYLARFLGTKSYFVQPIRNVGRNVIIYLPQRGLLWQMANWNKFIRFFLWNLLCFLCDFPRYQHFQFAYTI